MLVHLVQELGHLSPFSLVNDINLLTVLDSFALFSSSESSASKPGGSKPE